MRANGPLHDLVAEIIQDYLSQGPTSVWEIKAAAITAVQRGGGPSKFGFGEAYIYEMLGDRISDIAKSQLRGGLFNGQKAQIRTNAPPRLAEELIKLPLAIALSEGKKAKWVSSLKATADQWEVNAKMKADIAQKTIRQADESMSVALYLRKYGMKCLEDGIL